MTSHWQRLWDARLAKAVDQYSCDVLGMPAAALMETAGRGIAAEMMRRWPAPRPVLALCGSGNNGGDGMVAARVLHDAGYVVRVMHVAQSFAGRLSPLSAIQQNILDKQNIPQVRYAPGLIQRTVAPNSIIIDAVLGLGFSGHIKEGPVRDALQEVHALTSKVVVAVDLPSGLAADAVGPGFADPPLHADLTVTFGGRHPCLVASPQRLACGEVVLLDIGFPQSAYAQAQQSCPTLWSVSGPTLPGNPYQGMSRDRHKYDRGMVAVIGGSEGKTGAAIFAAMSALRTGAGWATIAGPEFLTFSGPPDVTFEPLFTGTNLSAAKLEQFLADRPVASLVIGPGVTENFLTIDIMKILRGYCDHGGFVVFDAGATHDLVGLLQTVPMLATRAVATPHPGEWLKMGLPNHPGSRADEVRQFSQQLGVSLVYKGATPLIFSGEMQGAGICADGGPELAKAGTGDVVAGCIGALGAAGMSALDATQRGLALVARAASFATVQRGREGATPSDFVDWLGIAQDAL